MAKETGFGAAPEITAACLAQILAPLLPESPDEGKSALIIHMDARFTIYTAGALTGGTGTGKTERDLERSNHLFLRQGGKFNAQGIRVAIECTDSQSLLKAGQSGSANALDVRRTLDNRQVQPAMDSMPPHVVTVPRCFFVRKVMDLTGDVSCYRHFYSRYWSCS